MRRIRVEFASGREVLSSYWGFLENGGLVLPDAADLAEGDPLLVEVAIHSLKRGYTLAARVVRQGDVNGRTFVAFDKGQEQDVMLNAAWADSNEVPQRKHRRFLIGQRVEYRDAAGARHDGRILDVSSGGCRLRGTCLLHVGTRIKMQAGDVELDGQVRWTISGGEMGIEFAHPPASLETLFASA